MRLLLEADADPNDSRDGQGTVLQIAAFMGYELIVILLLNANADVNLYCNGYCDGVGHL